MVKKRRRTPSGRGRLSWDGRLWDPDGRVYAGELPVHAELWQSGERQVLLFNDRD